MTRSFCVLLSLVFSGSVLLRGEALAAFAPADTGGKQLSYGCEDGVAFTITMGKRIAQVRTAGGSYELVRHRSSIGRKYASSTVAFIQDQDRAVLVGAEGGPFRNCR